MEKNQAIIAIGVDVSKETLAVCERYGEEKRFYDVKNDKREIGKWAKKIKGMNYQGKIVMESTGRYHLVLAMVLKESGLDARVINPLLSKKYASSSVHKVKTDKKDSEMLSCVALLEEKLPDAFQLKKDDILLKKKISLIAMLDKELQKMKASIKEFDATAQELGFKPSVCERRIIKTVAGLEKEKKELEKEIERIMKENHNEEMGRYATVPGISFYASSVFSLFFSPQHSLSPKQWIAFAGLDVSVRESGHWKGKGKLTKRGNGYLRKRLYQAAWGAIMHDDNFRNYYDLLRKEGKKYIEVLTIIARKLVVIMFNLSVRREDFDADKLSFRTV
jgi:transposase